MNAADGNHDTEKINTHKLILMGFIVACGFTVWFTSRDMGQELPPPIVQTADDIAAWQGDVFVLAGQTLTRLNTQLETVKSVQLPLDPSPVPPPEPVPGSTELSPQASGVETAVAGRVCADQQKVYVLYQGLIFTFDHDLNYLNSKPVGFTR